MVIQWLFMCFSMTDGKLVKILDLGEAAVEDIGRVVAPDDMHEMCDSYEVGCELIGSLRHYFEFDHDLFNIYKIFIERET